MFEDPRTHASIQLADIVASSTVFCHSRGCPEDFNESAKILDAGMLGDSIFLNFDHVDLKNKRTQLNYAVLFELAETADGRGMGAPIELFYDLTEKAILEGKFSIR